MTKQINLCSYLKVKTKKEITNGLPVKVDNVECDVMSDTDLLVLAPV